MGVKLGFFSKEKNTLSVSEKGDLKNGENYIAKSFIISVFYLMLLGSSNIGTGSRYDT
jgi:hypothetical protein